MVIQPLKLSKRKPFSRGGAESAEEKMERDDITGIIVNNATEIHKKLGQRLLESVYEAVLYKKRKRKGSVGL